MNTNECIAMLLAGGEGRRLAPLTTHLAKPAVPFGGRCRIIDYTLSNCINSGISTIGVLTQYKAESLHAHIGDGGVWRQACASKESEITLLPSQRLGSQGYIGTADAICQNIDFIDECSPEHVLVLSGDHIYQMDYSKLMDTHKASGASATIAVKRVPWKETSRFGIMNTDEAGRITSFVEKPAKAESNLASMGIYMFRWADLREALLADCEDPSSSHDFGKDIIPRMLRAGDNLTAHPFEGYWRDVGTVESLWEAHMDMLSGEMENTDSTGTWPLITKERKQSFRSYVSPRSDVLDSYIHEGSSIEGDIERSVIFGGVAVGRGTEIRESVIMPGARVGRQARLTRVIIGEGAVIEDGAVLGSTDGEIVVIGAGERVAGNPLYSKWPLLLPRSVFSESEVYQKAPIAFDKA
ncbi:glucose-1-phosphate adenylyltransferase [Paenibacillus phyllosphaerae]|uniref:Glucose-1-phosphate adenylyltransferase n=1 Tax=Paenibacillus phyllosphaerae TaxID=274593 RepID=A0A7W5AYY7_9BACL|nr:sugar phosphate nucleotidyltransferase [Paenibacillus phyllosphaerae]MBB3110691.1 glucose-1-phosphate adenylyltransferase [Paenibacillus phyllosphaerae]